MNEPTPEAATDPSRDTPAAAPLAASTAPLDLWERVKEHKVLQWGLAYLGAALALAHGADLLGHTFNWPEAINRLLLGLLIVGFPVALALAWYHGHRSLKTISTGEATIISMLVVIGAGLLILFVRAPEHTGEAAHSEQSVSAASSGALVDRVASSVAIPAASVAVLPFRDMSPAHDQDYFADGVAEEILNSLAGLQDLKVAARTSSFAFKNRDVDLRTIGETLGVRVILEGSIRKEGTQLRITAQLNNAATGYHIWSEAYDRPMDDIFKVQEDIARHVAAALQISLGVGDLGHQVGMTHNVQAYDAFLFGTPFSPDVSAAALRRGIDSLERAVALDPSFGLAWTGLYNLYGWAADMHLTGASPVQWAAKSDAAIEQMKSTMPHWVIEGTLADRSLNTLDWMNVEKHINSAQGAFPKPGTIGPAGEVAGIAIGRNLFLLITGRTREAIPLVERAVSGDPLNGFGAYLLSQAYANAGDLAAAIAEQDRGLRLVGGNFFLPSAAFLTALAAQDGPLIQRRLDSWDMPVQQKALIRRLLARDPTALAMQRQLVSDVPSASNTQVIQDTVIWLAYFGDAQAALDMLCAHWAAARSLRRNSYAMFFWDPLLRDVRKLPGFKQLVRDMGLVDYWRQFGWADDCHPVGTDDFACT